jgi:hypothetical protein
MTADAEPYHWPPELLRSLIDVIPLICRSKNDVVTFLRSAGADEELLAPWRKRLAEDKASVRKHEIVRDVVERLNEGGDTALRTRRELVKRVSPRWPEKRARALSSAAVGRHVALFVGATVVSPTSRRARNTQRFQAHKRQRPRMLICEALLTAHRCVLRKEVDLARGLRAFARPSLSEKSGQNNSLRAVLPRK